MVATAGSGWLVKASCEGFPHVQITGLRPQRNDRGEEGGPGYDELVVDLAEQFDLIPASVTMFSEHQVTKYSVHLGSQGDLDVVLAEAVEWGSHVITVSVTGVPARRALDAIGALADAVATVAQIRYLMWMFTESGAGFYRELTIGSIVIVTLIVNVGGFAYLLDDESDKNHPFRLWMRPLGRRVLMIVLAPFTGDVLPLVGCKSCGLDAPIRGSTRDGVVKWGVLMMAFQHGLIMWLLYEMHAPPLGQALTSAPLMCLYATAAALVLNLPRRVSHFVLGTCEAAFREKEELADDAKISMYAAQKMQVRASSPPPAGGGSPVGTAAPPPKAPVAGNGAGAPKAAAAKPKPAPAKPVKAMSFREQMKSGNKPKSMY